MDVEIEEKRRVAIRNDWTSFIENKWKYSQQLGEMDS